MANISGVGYISSIPNVNLSGGSNREGRLTTWDTLGISNIPGTNEPERTVKSFSMQCAAGDIMTLNVEYYEYGPTGSIQYDDYGNISTLTRSYSVGRCNIDLDTYGCSGSSIESLSSERVLSFYHKSKKVPKPSVSDRVMKILRNISLFK